MDFDQLTNHGMLEAMYLDRVLHRLSFVDYPNKNYMTEASIFERWLASD